MLPWQEELQNNLRTLDDLTEAVSLNEEDRQAMAALIDRFPLSVSRYYVSLIDPADPHDPIRKMALPSLLEGDLSGSFDTSGEEENTVVTGLQHKYAETVLMLSTHACATYCRHCFRKRLVGYADEGIAKDPEAVRAYILDHPEITNVLVSGGDALLNSNERLSEILNAISDIPHLDYIRLGTRVPVTFPMRITQDASLLELLKKHALLTKIYVVTQFNHPHEVSPEATQAVKALAEAGIPVRNQTVLLAGVNDDPVVLGTLLRKLTAIGAEPYYVFQCRPVSGVKNHFQVPLARAYEIVEGAKAMQSGFGKAFRFCMSHVSGKIEVLGPVHGTQMLFKYHEAKDRANLGRFFTKELREDQAWLD